jgi:predicted small secreted protein
MKRFLPLAILVIVATTVLAGCGEGPTAQSTGQALTERAFSQQQAATPYPADQLKDSQERHNLKERLLRTNNANHLSYLYVLSFGKPLGYYTVKGKVSSTQSQMTTDQLIVRACPTCSGGSERVVVNAPGDDGSYGPNESGVFFFTTEGAMVTTSLDYLISDQPVAFDVPKLNGTAHVDNLDKSNQ